MMMLYVLTERSTHCWNNIVKKELGLCGDWSPSPDKPPRSYLLSYVSRIGSGVRVSVSFQKNRNMSEGEMSGGKVLHSMNVRHCGPLSLRCGACCIVAAGRRTSARRSAIHAIDYIVKLPRSVDWQDALGGIQHAATCRLWTLSFRPALRCSSPQQTSQTR